MPTTHAEKIARMRTRAAEVKQLTERLRPRAGASAASALWSHLPNGEDHRERERLAHEAYLKRHSLKGR
jgi:hypothetical protein